VVVKTGIALGVALPLLPHPVPTRIIANKKAASKAVLVRVLFMYISTEKLVCIITAN
jgi:hypothetical protein